MSVSQVSGSTSNRIQPFHHSRPSKCCSFWSALKKVLIVISILALGYQVAEAANKPLWKSCKVLLKEQEMRLNAQQARLDVQQMLLRELQVQGREQDAKVTELRVKGGERDAKDIQLRRQVEEQHLKMPDQMTANLRNQKREL